MATLKQIKEIENSHLLRLGISEGEENAVYTVRESVYSELSRPIRGQELYEGEMEIIKAEDEYVRAKRRALYLLSYADNNERTLVAKLRERGFSSGVSAEVARDMVNLGYINETAQLERLITREANERLFGKDKILPRLRAKGYSVSEINSVMERLLLEGDIDFSENEKRLIEKKLPEGATEEERRALLVKYGYRKGRNF